MDHEGEIKIERLLPIDIDDLKLDEFGYCRIKTLSKEEYEEILNGISEDHKKMRKQYLEYFQRIKEFIRAFKV